MIIIDIRILKYFVTVAECLSFSKASLLLHVTQPTLSRQISYFEDELGTPLFVRSKPNLQLTLAGELCLEKAKEMLRIYDDMYEGISNLKKGIRGSVNIGYVNLSQFEILSKTVAAIRNSNLEIELNIYQKSLPESQKELLEDKLDLTFDMRTNSQLTEDICYEKLTKNKLYAVVPVNHNFVKRESILFHELKNENLVIFERRQAPELFDSITNLCRENGFTARLSAEGKDMESVMMLVGMGQGIALMDETAKILETSHTVFIPIDDFEMRYSWYLTWLKDNPNPCIPFVVETIKSLKADLTYFT